MTFADRYLIVLSACEFQVSAFPLSPDDENGRLGDCGVRVDVLTGVADEAVGGGERSICVKIEMSDKKGSVEKRHGYSGKLMIKQPPNQHTIDL